jgi:hypothetical protein
MKSCKFEAWLDFKHDFCSFPSAPPKKERPKFVSPRDKQLGSWRGPDAVAPTPTLSTSRRTTVTRAGLKRGIQENSTPHNKELKHNRAGETLSQSLDRSYLSSGLP